MNVLLFIIALAVSFIAVRLGAVAFELTELDWSMATFQALSCFTGTGFTTKESELITSNPQRRRIAGVLIIIGHAGFVTLVATFANSLSPNLFSSGKTMSLWQGIFSPELVPWVNLGIIILAIFASYKLAKYSRFDKKLTNFLRSKVISHELVKRVSFEELVVATGGYGISQIEVCQDSPVLDKTLMNSELRDADITILAVQTKGTIIPNPPARTKISLGDKLICFGKLENIRNKLCVVK